MNRFKNYMKKLPYLGTPGGPGKSGGPGGHESDTLPNGQQRNDVS